MAVERIKKRQETHRLGRLKLYQDELESIARTLAEFGKLKFTVNDEVSGSEPEDFAKLQSDLPERLDRVEIEAIKGESTVRVELGPGARIVLLEPDIASRGVLTSVKDICAHRTVKPASRAWSLGLGVLSLLLMFTLGVLMNTVGEDQFSSYWFSRPLGVIAMISFVASPVIYPSNKSRNEVQNIILNVPKAERPTFKERLISDGGVAAFWAGVGLIGGGLISWVVNQLPGL